MVLWIVLAVVVLALLVLALAIRPVLAGLPALNRAAQRLQRRQTEIAALQESAEALQEQLEGLAADAGETQRRIATIKAATGR
ncbi:hypothetical protein ACFFWC_12500 [Plantactinospora siamensis]|uniref:Phage shock protein B n=1 Tax=Plantactinospora siamensis TaxID=555372 RepID=A0ABV6P1S6_9ACTN